MTNRLPIPSAPGYAATAGGEIVSLARTVTRSNGSPYHLRERILTGLLSSGYYYATLHIDENQVRRSVHSLVAEAFHGPRPEDLVVRHLNGDPLDNRPENLRYGTPSENQYDRVNHGRNHNANKTHCPAGHSYAEHGRYERNGRGLRSRKCAECQRIRQRLIRGSRTGKTDLI